MRDEQDIAYSILNITDLKSIGLFALEQINQVEIVVLFFFTICRTHKGINHVHPKLNYFV